MGRRGKSRDSDDAKLREDAAETAYRTLQEAIGERPKTTPPRLGSVPTQERTPRRSSEAGRGDKRAGRLAKKP